MVRNYLKIAIRNLTNQKGYTFINITGLATGIACCLLIFLYVQDELSYDTFHDNGDRIYRVILGGLDDSGRSITTTPSAFAYYLRRDMPEVESAVRFYSPTRYRPAIITAGDQRFEEQDFFYADSTAFDIFTFNFLQGEPGQALTRPNTVVLTASTARKYFGNTNPMGQTLQYDAGRVFEVTGVIEDVPSNAHFSFDFLGSYVSLVNWSEASDETWRAANFFTYVLLREEATIDGLSANMNAAIERLSPQAAERGIEVMFQPLLDIHLRSDSEGDIAPQSDITYVYAFSVLAVLILLIACINYMNLATARSAKRAKEVGMRKALGAHRGQLTAQFYGESAFMALLSLGLALIVVALVLPAFNGLVGKELAVQAADPVLLGSLVAIALIVALVAGSYPALFLSSFKPVTVMKGLPTQSGSGGFIRKGLVVFQFGVSVFLMVGTAVVYTQLDHVQNKALGFDKEHIIILPIDRQMGQNYVTLKAQVEQNSNVISTAIASDYPGDIKGGYSATIEGIPDERFNTVGYAVDHDIVETLGFNVVAGNAYPDDYTFNADEYLFLLNQSLVRDMGLSDQEAVGRSYNLNGRQGRIVGVIEDFHFASLRDQIDPLTMFISPTDFSHMMIKVAGGSNLRQTLSSLEQTWATVAPHRPFNYQFLDQAFDALYRTEVRTGQIVGIFATLAILIACLGLFGLAAFTAEQRTKEIGVRKVMGASVGGIMLLLSKDFARLVIIAFVIAAPLAYVAMERWLQAYAYRIDLGVGLFLMAGIVALLIAGLTVSYQSLKAALADPVKALRYE